MPPAPASALALATTVHLGLVTLRKHRLPPSVFPWALLPSLLFCAVPWAFPPVAVVGAGLAIHLAWFVACEKLVPAPVAAGGPCRVEALARRGSLHVGVAIYLRFAWW